MGGPRRCRQHARRRRAADHRRSHGPQRAALRSDNLQDLTPADIRHLVEVVGVTDVVDLRSDVEYHVEGPGR